MTVLFVRAHGVPAAQGSKKGFVNKGRVQMVESSAAVKPWREAVKFAALDAMPRYGDPLTFPLTGPVQVVVAFWFARPKSHFGSGRNAAALKDGAPDYIASKPDLDKLLRSTFDALTDAGVLKDDAQIVTVAAVKRYVRLDGLDQTPGATIRVSTGEDA